MSVSRRRVLAWAAAVACLGAGAPAAGAETAPRVRSDWPQWRDYLSQFVQADGRVIDDQHATRYTTSEGQAYTLFFCLVANDRSRFDTLLAWTERHLAGGDLAARLPGWRWGRRDDGSWSLVDANPAADADLWLAYTLFEAARLWSEARYAAIAHALLRRIRELETVDLPGFGWMLLPAPVGFRLGAQTWRFNPSYLAIHQLRLFARHDPGGPWLDLAANTVTMLRATAPLGFAPDWVNYSAEAGWHADAASPAEGSHDAIRTYLWAGLLHAHDPLRPALLRSLGGMRDWLAAGQPAPPLRVRTDRGAAAGTGPPGFSAALLPYLRSFGETRLAQRQMARLRAATVAPSAGADAGANAAFSASADARPNYYDRVLGLFGQGALEGRFRFDRHGALQAAWHPATPSRP